MKTFTKVSDLTRRLRKDLVDSVSVSVMTDVMAGLKAAVEPQLAAAAAANKVGVPRTSTSVYKVPAPGVAVFKVTMLGHQTVVAPIAEKAVEDAIKSKSSILKLLSSVGVK